MYSPIWGALDVMGVKYKSMQQAEVYPRKLTLTRLESRMKYIGINPNSHPPMSNNDMKNM